MEFNILDKNTLALIFWSTNLQKKVLLAWHTYTILNSKINISVTDFTNVPNNAQFKPNYSSCSTALKQRNPVRIEKFFFHWRSFTLARRKEMISTKIENFNPECRDPVLRKLPRMPLYLFSSENLSKQNINQETSNGYMPSQVITKINNYKVNNHYNKIHNKEKINYNLKILTQIPEVNISDFTNNNLKNEVHSELILLPPSIFVNKNLDKGNNRLINDQPLLRPGDIQGIAPKIITDYNINNKNVMLSNENSENINFDGLTIYNKKYNQEDKNIQNTSSKEEVNQNKLKNKKLKFNEISHQDEFRSTETNRNHKFNEDKIKEFIAKDELSIKNELIKELVEIRNKLKLYANDIYTI